MHIYKRRSMQRGSRQAGRPVARPVGRWQGPGGLVPMPVGWWVCAVGDGMTTVEGGWLGDGHRGQSAQWPSHLHRARTGGKQRETRGVGRPLQGLGGLG